MTQAYNLSQLANNLNSAGQVDATDGLVNAVPLTNGGTGATTAAAARTNLGVAASVYAVPAGGIILWSGSIASVPSGWFLCNGANGTPNLLDRFVVAAGSTYAVAQTGGTADAVVVGHSHTFSVLSGAMNANAVHSHTYNHSNDGAWGSLDSISGNAASRTDGTFSTNAINIDHTHNVSGSTATAGVSGTNQNLPPFYALAYIMKS